MPRRLPSSESSASYVFPIVAAFLCTAGALCTLVYGYDRQGAHVAHVAGVLEEARDDAEQLFAQRELLAVRSLHLGQSREKTQAELALKQAELSHVEDHTRRLRDQAEKLSLAIRELENQDGSQSREVDVAKAELDRLQRAIVAAEAELKEKELANRDRPVTYSVVPYEGPNQTKRRPIYIECRRDSVVIQPEGVVLRDQDFEPPLGPGNPLAAAIRAYSEYLARAGFTGETTRPYPMLLVRPDGIEAYYAARSALQTWGTEFGYELVGEDWTLQYPPLEPRLTTVLDQVVQDARMRQETLAAAAPRQFKRAPTALRASPNGRGFIAEGDSSGRNRYGGSGYASRSTGSRFGANGRGTGSGWGEGTTGSGAEPGGNAPDGFGTGNSATPGMGTGTGAGSGDSLTGGGLAAAGQEPGNGLGGFESGDQFGQGGGGRPGAANGDRTALGTAGENPGSQGSASQQGTDGRPGGSYAAADGTQPGSPGDAAEGSRYGRGTDASGSAFGDPRSANAGQPGAASNEKNEMGPYGSPGQGFQANQQQAASAGAGNARVGGPPGGAGSPQAGPSAGGQSSQGESQGMPSATAHVSPPGKKPSSIASKRGRDWGLPDGSASMVPVTRPIIVRCEPHQLTIMPEDNRTLPQTIPLTGRTDASVDKLVSGVWDYMKSWGLAGRGMYWRPTLSMEVAPGAEGRFEELQALLQDSGMEVKRRQTPTQRR